MNHAKIDILIIIILYNNKIETNNRNIYVMNKKNIYFNYNTSKKKPHQNTSKIIYLHFICF